VVFSELFINRMGGGYVNPQTLEGEQTPHDFDFAKFYNDQPDLILTNGEAFKYVPHIGDGGTNNECKFPGQEGCTLTLNSNAAVFKVLPGELTRWYIFNAGPNDGVAFHFIGTYQDDYHGFDPTPIYLPLPYPNAHGHWYPGHLIKQDMNDQVNWIPPASGQIIEAKFPQIATANSHNFLSQSANPRSQDNSVSLYVGVDHNMNHVIKGGAFAVVAVPGPLSPPGMPPPPADEPIGTWVPPINSTCVDQNECAGPLRAVANATK